MESLVEGQDLGPSGGEGRQLEGVLVSLGPAVAKEEGVVGVTAQLAQLGSQRALEAVLDSVGVETQRLCLLGQDLHIVRMAMAHADDGMAAIEVRIGLAVGRP